MDCGTNIVVTSKIGLTRLSKVSVETGLPTRSGHEHASSEHEVGHVAICSTGFLGPVVQN